MTKATINVLSPVLTNKVAEYLTGKDLSFFARTSKNLQEAHWQWTSKRDIDITPYNMLSFIQYAKSR